MEGADATMDAATDAVALEGPSDFSDGNLQSLTYKDTDIGKEACAALPRTHLPSFL